MNVAAVAAALVLVLVPGIAQAQTLTACYVPKSGSVYRIKAQNTPTACKANHVEFNWEAAATGVAGYQVRSSDPAEHDPNYTAAHFSACAPGEVAVGGGYFIDPSHTYGVGITSSGPSTYLGAKGWAVTVANSSSATVTVRVYAVCLQAAAGS